MKKGDTAFTVIGFFLGIALLAWMLYHLVESFPEAAHAETVNQRAIASHGYNEYLKFTETNNGK